MSVLFLVLSMYDMSLHSALSQPGVHFVMAEASTVTGRKRSNLAIRAASKTFGRQWFVIPPSECSQRSVVLLSAGRIVKFSFNLTYAFWYTRVRAPVPSQSS
eukprot:2807505-Amphidinium_carterae.5